MNTTASMRLLRHATLYIEIGGVKFIVDPMLCDKDYMEPIQNAANQFRIPMTDLPVNKLELENLIRDADAVLVTHTHRDHWDEVASKLIPKSKPLFCQPADTAVFTEQGFTSVAAIEKSVSWKGVKISRTGGQHGTGEIGKAMGTVSGFVLQAGEKSIYVAGDTIWCEEVNQALSQFKPKTIVLNAGGARFLKGDAITMEVQDIVRVAGTLPDARIIAVHMDTVNHCLLKRADLRPALEKQQLASRVSIPIDGETLAV